jgi:hypothetical protein
LRQRVAIRSGNGTKLDDGVVVALLDPARAQHDAALGEREVGGIEEVDPPDVRVNALDAAMLGGVLRALDRMGLVLVAVRSSINGDRG